MKKFILYLLLVTLIIALVAISSLSGGNGDYYKLTNDSVEAGSQSPKAHATLAADATATFGAEQFHLQLTAIAEQEE